jgi:hypothetical protein
LASTAVISCAAQPGFDAPVPAALRTLFGWHFERKRSKVR